MQIGILPSLATLTNAVEVHGLVLEGPFSTSSWNRKTCFRDQAGALFGRYHPNAIPTSCSSS